MKSFFTKCALISASISMLFASNASAGFLIQGGVGAATTKIKLEEEYVRFLPLQVSYINTDEKMTGVFVRIAGGYQIDLNSKFKPAFILAAGWQSGSNSSSAVFPDGVVYNTKLDTTTMIDLYAKLGYEFSKEFMLYGNIGFTGIGASVNRRGNGFLREDKNISSGGLLVGVGAEGRVAEKLAMFVEINGRFTEDEDNFSLTGNTTKVKSNNASAEVGVRYYF